MENSLSLAQGHSPSSPAGLTSDVAGHDNVDIADGAGRNRLHIACLNGNLDAVRPLLGDNQMNVDRKDNYGNTALNMASWKGYKEIVGFLLTRGAGVDIPNNIQWTPLKTASQQGHKGVVRLLLNWGANVDTADKYGWTPLKAASREGHEAVVQLLLQQGANVDTADKDGWTPLKAASRYGHAAVVRLLLNWEANVDTADKDGWTPLKAASREGHEAVVPLLLQYGADVDKADKDGWTPLKAASREGHEAVVQLLLRRRANVDKADNDGWTPLKAASRYGHEAVVQLLLRRGANVDTADKYRWTSLKAASQEGHEAVVQLLLQHRADVDKADKDGWTPLKAASRYGHEAVVQLLLQHRANVDKADNDGCTPLGSASRHGHKAIVELLLNNKAVVDKAEKPEWIPLHQASFYGHRAVVKLLLDRKANIAIQDSDKRTALHKASQQGYEATVQLLVESQASVNAVDKDKWTALHFASFHCPEDVQRLDNDEMGSKTNDRKAITGTAEHTGQHDDVVRLLLSSGANPARTTINYETALHLAATKNSGHRVKMLLDKMRESERAAADINGATALYIAAERRNPDAVYQLLEGLQTAEFGKRDIEKDTLIWAAEKEETHKIVQLLFQKSKIKATGSKFFPPDNKWSALEWAGYAGSLQVVCRLLRASAPTPENDRNRKAAGRLVGKVLDAMRNKRIASAGEGRHENSIGDDGEGQAEKNQPYLLEDYKLIRDVLGDPPIFKTSSPRPYVKPRLEFAIPSFEAAIVDFYAWGERTGFLRRFRSVRDVIYNEGPKKIMLEARESQPKVNAAMQQGTADLGRDEDPPHSDHLKFRWIHLPANNMQWMNDLTLRIFIDDEKPEVDFADFSSFVRKSWHETPDAVSKSRFMKPVCVANGDTESRRGPRTSGPATRRVLPNNQEGQLGGYSTDIDVDSRVQDKRGHQLALYMPYLTFAREAQDAKGSPEYTNLLECYKQNVIHGSRTLDEFFYHFAQDAKLKSEMQRRNGDQVVTREITGPTKGLEYWTILRVDQLWLWVVDEKTIITSSTHRVDGAEDPVLTRVLNRLSKESDGWGGQSQPDSAYTMARLIVDSCTEFYDLPVEIEYRDREAQKAVVSARQIFSDAIAKAAIIEANLFENFTKPNKRSHGKQDAAKLLYHVKDIRDELNILKAVATHQRTVEGGFPGGLSPSSYSASYVMNDIEEQDKVAMRILAGANETLSLELSEIANSQSDETVKQGRTLTVFTVITILFVTAYVLSHISLCC
ncbi:hypothetical protein FPRO04_14341 [Fusarium proliferatum]|nr:hypothetical protein FPRO04_14341 [Fusarium proliferatum]